MKSEEARRLQEALLNAATELAHSQVGVVGLLGPVIKIAEVAGDNSFVSELTAWKADVDELKSEI